MGKGHNNKGKPGHKQNNKPRHMSAQNKKQLAKLDRILQHKKDRSQSKGNSKQRQNNRFDRNKNNNNNQRFNNNQRNNNPRNNNLRNNNQRSNSYSQQKGGNNKQQRNNNQWTQKSNNKTKQIHKQFGNKQFKNKIVGDQQQGNGPIKGNPLFQIIPQGMDEDAFAALGGNQESQNEQISDSQVSNQDNEEYQDQYDYGNQQEEQAQEEQAQEGDEQLDQEGMDQQEQDQNQAEQQQEEFDQQNGQQEFDQQGEQEFNQNQQGDENQQQGQQVNQQENRQQAQENNQQIQPQQDKQPVDISVISLKIQQTIQILMNVAKLGGGKTRKHFIEQLKNLVHQYYGYNFELVSHFLDFLNPSEMIQFFQANETQRPLTIRTNTLKTRRKQLAQSLIQRGVNLDPLAQWSNVGIKIYETKVPIGATPEYLAGHYMLQSASSLLPVIALDPQPYQKVLDMASAPGGKTTYIAQLMKNTGSIFANDLKKQRLRALQFNLYRLGVTNTAVTCRDGRKFPIIFPSTFDRVLLDAPCTGLGIIAKDHSIKATRLMIDIYKNSHLQKELLLAAIDSCKVNGTIVYSTCSVSPLQNEQVVNYALKRRFIKIVDCGIQVGQQGLIKFVEKRFHVDLKKTRRIYPHVHNMDGFYVAKLIKVGKGKKQIKQDQQQNGQNMVEEGDINEQVDE